MFQLTEEEAGFLRPHFTTSKRGGRRYRPYVFTQEGVVMLSSVLHSVYGDSPLLLLADS
jgi:hypothetical protein